MKVREAGFKGVTTKDLSQELIKILLEEMGGLDASSQDGNYQVTLHKQKDTGMHLTYSSSLRVSVNAFSWRSG